MKQSDTSSSSLQIGTTPQDCSESVREFVETLVEIQLLTAPHHIAKYQVKFISNLKENL